MTKYYHICSERSWRYNRRSNERDKNYLNNKIIVKNILITNLREKLKENTVLQINYNFLKECYNTTYNNFQELYNRYTDNFSQLNETIVENETYRSKIEEVKDTLNGTIENYERLQEKYDELRQKYEELKVKIEVN